MAEAPEPIIEEPQETPPEPIVEPEPAPLPDTEPDDGKPGGDDGQAVRARKEYQARKRAEERAQREHEQVIALEARLKALEETRKEKPAERVYTMAEVRKAVRDNVITEEDADRYIEEALIPKKVETLFDKREKQAQARMPIVEAGKYIDDYVKILPTLNDTRSNDFVVVAQKYGELVRAGMPDDARTQKVAIELTHGDLEKTRKRVEMAKLNSAPRTIPVDGSGGGGNGNSAPKVDLAKAPELMRVAWEKTGTTQADREREFSMHMAKEATRQKSAQR